MMQGSWLMWSLGMFIFWGALLIGLALVARALGMGRRAVAVLRLTC
jgi:hypothetical protein